MYRPQMPDRLQFNNNRKREPTMIVAISFSAPLASDRLQWRAKAKHFARIIGASLGGDYL
jgi:hypothetical protein